jgi:hypothetical protein
MPNPRSSGKDPESRRLAEDAARRRNWKRWGPYLAERQWATVREDYSAEGEVWSYFPHDHARSRAYRWGEDGLLGITDRECRLCFALALWNGRDPILKERLFGLTGPEGNHGEDVKECYWYLASTPTHSYMRALYKYPQREFPYAELVEENRRRGREQAELELEDTSAFEEGRYFDVQVEYAKAGPDDILVRIEVANRGPEAAQLDVLPTLWFRNTWVWGTREDAIESRPRLSRAGALAIDARHPTLGHFALELRPPEGTLTAPELYFTENETNAERLWGQAGGPRFAKDAFHERVVRRRADAVNPEGHGTKAAFHASFQLAPGAARTLELRLRQVGTGSPPNRPAFGADFARTFEARRREHDRFYSERLPAGLSSEERNVLHQLFGGLCWSRQFYHYVVQTWLDGDPAQPPPPPSRRSGRNADWRHVYNRDVISMPDKWEYPWYAAWDLAFHMIPFAEIDPEFAKAQLLLFLREWYMHPNGQIPAYEFAFSDVNPPVHAWAVWRVYKISAPRGERDRRFLVRAFHKLLINFTWWVNRKDPEGNHLFSGGFLGLDNIGVFDRSAPMPRGHRLEQADGTAWMAFYCATMLSIALELAAEDSAYEDVASKFFEHFVAICDAMNTLGGSGLWDQEDGFYYDKLLVDGAKVPMRVRSMVGIIPLFAVEILEQDLIDRCQGFKKRMQWFLDNRRDLAAEISYMERSAGNGDGHRLLAIPSRERLVRVLHYVLDEDEFLSPYGVRSLSRVHAARPFELRLDGSVHRVAYEPGESRTGAFGGNSNWRGPVWFPLNYLLVEALERYHHFYGEELRVECPTGSGTMMNLREVAGEIGKRLARLFLPDLEGERPCQADSATCAHDPHWKDLVLFHEYFHGDTGKGLGASHQTGWTALAARFIQEWARSRERLPESAAGPR